MKKILLATVVTLIVAGAVWAMSAGLLTLESLQHYHRLLANWQQQSPLPFAGIFFLLYTLIATLSIPGIRVLAVLGGALFGLAEGTLLVSFASTLGATFAMLTSRYLLRGWISRRFSRQLARIDEGMVRDGAFYLFALRLMPLFPFSLVNLLCGVANVRVRQFWWISQIGMLPATLIYLNAGSQLSQLTSISDIISPGILAAFALLGLLPLLSRWLIICITRRKNAH